MPKNTGVACVLAAAAACTDPKSPVCSDIANPDFAPAAIVLSVRDSVTGAGALLGSTAVAREGAYTDSVYADPLTYLPSKFWLAEGRPGTYVVTVTKPNYSNWVRTGVRVTIGECGGNMMSLTARLQPVP